MMSGTRLIAFASRWFEPAFEPAVVASVFEPLVADWQRESCEATPAHRRLIDVRARDAFAITIAMLMPRLAMTSTSLGTRPLRYAGGFWLITSCLLTIPFAKDWQVGRL